MANPLICVFNPVTSFIDEVQSISTGPAAIGVPIVTNLLGVIDTSLLGIGVTATAGQAIPSGTLVNLYSFGGTLHAQVASAQSPTFPNPTPPTPPSGGAYPLQAQGFAASSASLNQAFTVSFFGTFKYVDGNSEFNSGSIGQEVYLSDRGDGSITLTPPSGPGELEQAVGYVVSFTTPNIVIVNFASGFQDFSHISGVNPITKGGTGATTAPQALINLIGGSPSTGQALIWNGSAWVPGTDTATFAQITTGTNTTATMTVGTGASLTFSGSGVINANQLTGDPVNTAGRTPGQALVWNGSAWAPSSGAVTFAGITSGTNTTATMTVGTGASIVTSGTGIVEATELATTGAAVVVSSAAPPSTGQALIATSATTATWSFAPGVPASPSTSVQFNNAGVFGGNANLEWDNTNFRLTSGIESSLSAEAAQFVAAPFSDKGAIRIFSHEVTTIATDYSQDLLVVGDSAPALNNVFLLGVNVVKVVNPTVSSPASTMVGLEVQASKEGNNDFGTIIGVEASASIDIIGAGSSGTTTDCITYHALTNLRPFPAGPNVTRSTGLLIDDLQFNGGNAVTSYGIRIDPQAVVGGTTAWSIFETAPSAGFVQQNQLGSTSFIGGVGFPIVTKISTYTAAATDFTILGDTTGGPFTIHLPITGIFVGQTYRLKNIGNPVNLLTIDTVGGATNIDFGLTQTLPTQGMSMDVQWNGTQWWIL